MRTLGSVLHLNSEKKKKKKRWEESNFVEYDHTDWFSVLQSKTNVG